MDSSFRPSGFTTLTPLVAAHPASEAIRFYEDVFGARVATRMDGPDGAVWHAELELDCGRMQVMDPNPQFAVVGPDPGSDEVTFSLAIYVPDVDDTLRRAVEHGATVREEADDFDVTGDRFASIRDPFGVRWTIMTRVHERSDAEIQQGLDAWAASLAEQP